jgi:PAS domain S-box-containing protein
MESTSPQQPFTPPRPGEEAVLRPGDATQRRLRLIIESAPVGLMLADPTGRVLAANQAWLSLFGISGPEAIVGSDVLGVITAESRDAFATFLQRTSNGELGPVEYDASHRDGRTRRMESQGVPLRRPDGAPVVLTSTSDVTARKRVESAYDELRAIVARQQEALVSAQAEHDRLAQMLHDLNASYAELVNERAEERRQSDAALEAEKTRSTQLLDEREEWRAKLADILRCARDAGDQAQSLLESCRTLRLVTQAHEPDGDASSDQEPDAAAI